MLVSIILPTYNRAKFLPEAIAAIRGQQFTDWELIVVDDGSNDGTAELIPQLCAGMPQPLRYIAQENQGAYAARNTGLDHATGQYIAFYDSDDVWLPHHLQDCVTALETHADVDWVYGATRIVEMTTREVRNENCFYENRTARTFLKLPTEPRGSLRVLKPEGLLESVIGGAGLYCGLQNSVIRSDFFRASRFVTDYYNEAEDQLVVLRALAQGRVFAYFDAVHVIYRIHESNSSAAATGLQYEKRVRLMEGLIRGYEDLPRQISLSTASQRALRRHLAELYFWNLGYVTHWMNGNHPAAMTAFGKGLKENPWRIDFWKTFVSAALRRSVFAKPTRGAAAI